MKLADAACYFDKLVVSDSYGVDDLILGQLDMYDDVKRDGITAVRRILSVRPGTIMPSRRAVTINDEEYLVSHLPAYDFFKSSPIRSQYILHRSDGLAEIKTVLQELTNSAGVSAYAAKVWVKSTKEVDESSDADNRLNIYLAKGEQVVPKDLIKLGTDWFVVRLAYSTASGYLNTEVDQLDAPNFETATYDKRVYNPITDSHTTTATSVKLLRLSWQSSFEYLNPLAAKYAEGDDVVMVAAAAIPAPTTGDVIHLADGDRRVDDFYSVGGVWHLHVRRT
jgi:hypothetical protein